MWEAACGGAVVKLSFWLLKKSRVFKELTRSFK